MDKLDNNVALGETPKANEDIYPPPPPDNSGDLTLSYDKAGGHDEAEGFVAAWKRFTRSMLRLALLVSLRYRIFRPVA